MVFPTFFNLSLNFAIRSWWFEPQSAPGLCWLYSFSIFGCKEYNQSDFSIDYLMMSIPCVVGKGCLLWSVYSLVKTVSLCPAPFCTPRPNLFVTLGISWLLSLHSKPLWWKGHLSFFFFLLLILGLGGLHIWTVSASLVLVVGAQTWITVMLNGLP